MKRIVFGVAEGMFIAHLLWRNVLPVPNPAGAILHFSDCYEPRTGGIETQVANLAKAQRLAGMNVQVVTATVGRRIDDVHRISAPIPFELPVHPRTRARVAELVGRINPSVAHVHLGVTSPFAWGALRALNEMNIPTVVTVHSMWGPVARAGYSAASRIASWRSAGARVVWSAVSEEAAIRVEQSLHMTVHQMPNGIDLASWCCESSTTGSTRIISVLRMAPRKRVIPLLKIIDLIQQQTQDSTAVVVGDGPLLKRAKSLATKSGLNIEFKGRLKPAQIREEFAQSDIFLQASIHESFGIAALEARTAGLVVLARRGTGTASFIVDGLNGYLANSDRDMTATAIRLSHNPDEIRLIKDFNRENPPQFDWHSVVSISRELYASARDRPMMG